MLSSSGFSEVLNTRRWTNPPAGDQHLSANGSNWLWAVFALFFVAFLAFAILTAIRKGERIFHYLFTVALLAGTIAYFAMASDLAWTVISQANYVHHGSRQIFFAKYIFWTISFPVVIIALGLISAVAWATILYNILLAWVWILSYLFAAYTATNYKWGFFALGTLAWLLLAHNTLIEGRRSLAHREFFGKARTHHTALAAWTNLLWLNYVIAFAVSDSGNVIGVTGSFIYFGILDLLMVPVLAAAFHVLGRKWDYGRMNIAFTQFGRVGAQAVQPREFAGKNDVASPVGGPGHVGNGAGHPAAAAAV